MGRLRIGSYGAGLLVLALGLTLLDHPNAEIRARAAEAMDVLE